MYFSNNYMSKIYLIHSWKSQWDDKARFKRGTSGRKEESESKTAKLDTKFIILLQDNKVVKFGIIFSIG